MKVRVYQELSGNLRILRLNGRLQNDGETDDAFVARLSAHAQAGDPSLQGLPFVDLDETEIPANRSDRNKFRLRNGRCVVDQTIPDPPHPKRALLDRAATANSVAELRQVLVDSIKDL